MYIGFVVFGLCGFESIKFHNRYIASQTRIILMPIENAEQIGDGPLHIIISEEFTTKTEGRTIWPDSKLLWFKIANLNKNEDVIENQELIFEGENTPFMARDLSDALKYLIERTYVNQMRTGLNLSVDRLDNGNVMIKNGPAGIEVNQEDIAELADKLDYVNAIGTTGLQRR